MPQINGGPWGIVPPDGKITAHFSWLEAGCRCCGRIGNMQQSREQANLLEIVRMAVGQSVVHVNSWWRCPKHNREVGGKEHSYHLLGEATDITVRDMGPRAVQIRMRKLQKNGIIGGIGVYSAFTHIDRGPRREWRG